MPKCSCPYDDVPWRDCTKWKPGSWYPMPVGSMWTKPEVTVHEGYDIFVQDPESPEDIIPAGNFGPFTFREAVNLCEAHNGWSFDL